MVWDRGHERDWNAELVEEKSRVRILGMTAQLGSVGRPGAYCCQI